MQSVTIFPIAGLEGEPIFRAISPAGASEGRTAGEALDAARAVMPANTSGTVIIIQPFSPDQFFSAEQRARLAELILLRKEAEDAGLPLTAAEDKELRELVEAELEAAILRTEQIAQGLGK